MKISKKFLIYIGVGVYVIAAAAVFYILMGKLEEKDKVNDELALAQANLEKSNITMLNSRNDELEEQLAQITSQTDTLKNMMSQDIENVAASTIVFDIADSSGVEVTYLSSPSASKDTLENVEYTVILLETTVEGSVKDLVNFVTRLNAFLTTGNIKSVELNIPDPTDNVSPTASISLNIYNYQGD